MQKRGPRLPISLTAKFVIVFVAVFALQCINDVYLGSPAEGWLALTSNAFRRGWIWQFFTFQFLHGSLLHIVCNLIAFWWLGQFVETVLGPRRFLLLLIGGGAVGGILQGILMVLFPEHFGSRVVGASAGVCSLLAVFALLERSSEVRFNFVLPIQAIWLLWIEGGISLFFTLVPAPRSGIAHAAHLGGLLAGVAFVKLGWHRDFIRLPWEEWLDSRREVRSRRRRLASAAGSKRSFWQAHKKASDEPEFESAEFISREVDPILDKISAHGIHSLTERERRILEAARARMAKR